MVWESIQMGIVIGLVGGIPVGPMGALALQQGLGARWTSALGTGLGASFWMFGWAYASFLFLSQLEDLNPLLLSVLKAMVGVLFLGLCYSGLKKLFFGLTPHSGVSTGETQSQVSSSFGKSFGSAWLIGAMRPTTSLVILGVHQSFFKGEAPSSVVGLSVSAGAANALWFLILLAFSYLAYFRISPVGLKRFQAGLLWVVGAFGVWLLAQGIWETWK